MGKFGGCQVTQVLQRQISQVCFLGRQERPKLVARPNLELGFTAKRVAKGMNKHSNVEASHISELHSWYVNTTVIGTDII